MILGLFYILLPATATHVLNAAQGESYVFIDDAWITGKGFRCGCEIKIFIKVACIVGILAHKAEISHIDLDFYTTTNTDRLLFLKLAQDTLSYKYDLLAGPTRRKRKLTHVLEKKAKWCWQNRCFNNIYHRKVNMSEDDSNLAKVVSDLIKDAWVNEH